MARLSTLSLRFPLTSFSPIRRSSDEATRYIPFNCGVLDNLFYDFLDNYLDDFLDDFLDNFFPALRDKLHLLKLPVTVYTAAAMTVRVVSSDQDPRRSALAHEPTQFSSQPEDFPHLPGCGVHAQQDDGPVFGPVTRPWPHVFKEGELATLPLFYDVLRLPRELRFAIWKFALQGQYETIRIRSFRRIGEDIRKPTFLPPICYMSEQTMEETIAAVIEGSVIIIESFDDNVLLRAFLNLAPGRNGVIRQLNFDSFSRCPEGLPVNQDLELAVRCTGLRTIKLTFDEKDLTRNVLIDETYGYRVQIPKNPEDLYAEYKLERLLDCKMLSLIIITQCGWKSEPEDVVNELGQMLRQAIAKNGIKLIVEIRPCTSV